MPGGAVLDEELRIKMRMCRIGRARRMDKGELLVVPQRLQTGQCRVQAEMIIEWQRPLIRSRRSDGDGRSAVVISSFAMGNDDIEALDRGGTNGSPGGQQCRAG